MKTLNITVSDLEYDKFGINSNNLTFSEFLELVDKELTRQALDNCIKLAEKYRLSDISMEEINEEVKAVRNAKSSS